MIKRTVLISLIVLFIFQGIVGCIFHFHFFEGIGTNGNSTCPASAPAGFEMGWPK
jgi:hypothetical protein